MVGEILNGRYEILKSVGFGGMAEVYLAKDVLLDRKIAIKVLRKKFLDSKAQLDQFKREARSAARLIHPSIVTIYDVCDEGDISYILMEYVEGVSLKAFEEQNGRMDPALAVALTAQLASALDHAHKHNIIHCDIKPQNIVLTEAMVPKIVDFGISRIVSNETMAFTASVVGSVHYFSPEQAQGLPVTAQSDIYSLGIVFYEMLTGKVPFDGSNAVSVARMQVEEEAPPLRTYWPEAPDALQRIVDKALAKRLEDRYATAEDMKNDLMDLKNQIYPSKNNEMFIENTIPLQAITKSSPVKAAAAAMQQPESEKPGYQTLIIRNLPDFLTREVDDRTNEYGQFEEPASTKKMGAVAPSRTVSDAQPAVTAAATAAVAGAAVTGAISAPEQQELFTDEPEITDAPEVVTGQTENGFHTMEPEHGTGYAGVEREPVPAVPANEKTPTYPEAKEVKTGTPGFVAAAVNTEPGRPVAAEANKEKLQMEDPTMQRKYNREEKQKKKSGIFGILLKVLLIFILLAGAAAAYFFSASKPDIVVPDVNGKTVAEAQKILKDQGFRVELEEKVDASVKPGMVLRMDPVAGAKRKSGAAITLIVSSAEKMIAVPSIVGLKQEEAEKILADKHLRIEKVDQKWDSTKPEGIVLSQSPEADSKLEDNGGISIIVNKKEEKNLAVPDLKGLTLEEAKQKLSELKLNVEVKEVDSDRDKGIVLASEPGNGATLMEGSTVTLQVSNAKKQITFPASPDKISSNVKPNSSVTVSPSTGSRYVEFVVPGTGSHAVQIVSNNGKSQKIEVSGAYNGGVRLRTKVDSDVKRVGFYVDHRLIEEKSW